MVKSADIESDCHKVQSIDLKIGTENDEGAYTYEEALEHLGLGKFHYKLLVICGILCFSVMTEISGIGVILPVLACDMDATITHQGLLLSGSFIELHSVHIHSVLLRIFGDVQCNFYHIIALSVNILMLILMRIAVGVFISSLNGCVFTLVGEFLRGSSRGLILALVSGFQPLSNILVPLLSMYLLPLPINIDILGVRLVTWRIFYIISAVVAIISTLGMMTIPESPKFLLYRDGSDKAVECLSKVFASNTGRPASEYPVKSIILDKDSADIQKVNGICDAIQVIASQTAAMFYRERCFQTILLGLFMFILNGVIQGLFLWLPTILDTLISSTETHHEICNVLSTITTNKTETANISKDTCSQNVDQELYMVLIFVGIIFTISYILFAFLVDFVGKKNLLVFWVFVISCLLGVLQFITNKFLVMFTLTMIVNAGVCSSLVGLLCVEFYPSSICAMACCGIIMVSRIGAVIGSNVMGQFIFSDCELSLWVMFGTFMSLSFLGLFLPEQKQKKKNDKKPQD